jgi:hypothetical protein
VYRELQRLAAIAEQGDLALICWCSQPDRHVPCHGDVLKSAILWMNSATAGTSTAAVNSNPIPE